MAKKASSEALAKREDGILAHVDDVGSVIDALAENLGGETISAFDLPRIPMPSGKTMMFMVPTLENPGGEASKTIEGVIIHTQANRTYWEKGLDEGGGGERPDCFSDDGIVGYGNPGGKCAECSMAQFGSGKGNTQACTLKKALYILQTKSLLPICLAISPGSLKPGPGSMKTYMLTLAGEGTHFSNVVTEISLVPDKSEGGIDYGRAVFRQVRSLDDDEHIKVQQYRKALVPSISKKRTMNGNSR